VELDFLFQEFSDFLTERKDSITETWLAREHDRPDPASAEPFPRAELIGHLSPLIDELVRIMRYGVEPKKDDPAAFPGKTKGSQPWAQHYQLDDLLRELGVLRRVIQDELEQFYERRPEFHFETTYRAAKILGQFLDEVAVICVTHFVGEQQAHLEEETRALASVNTSIQSTNEELQTRDAARLRLLRTASHELRNALGQLSLIAHALTSEKQESMRNKLTRVLRDNIDHMTALVAETLDLSPAPSGHESLHVGPGDLAGLGENLSVSFRALAAAKGISFTMNLDPALKGIATDQEKIRRIITNLVTNGIKYTDAGQVNLEMRIIDDSSWSITVADSGAGIPPEHLDQIFEEFHRVPEMKDRPGHGLGLAITRQLVLMLGGRIEMQSEVGEGTLVRVTLPRASAESQTGHGS